MLIKSKYIYKIKYVFFLIKDSLKPLILLADIDECREGTHLCDQFQNCINTFGGHECRCKNGFELDSGSGSCVGQYLVLYIP